MSDFMEPPKPRFFKWIVEFEISDNWIADGFDLGDGRAKDIIENALPFAYGHETKAKVLQAPSHIAIMREQGYKSVLEGM